MVISKSQLTKRSWLVGGMGKFYSYHQTHDAADAPASGIGNYIDLDVSASLGYFIANKLVMGLRPSFSWYKGSVARSGGLTTNISKFFAGPFVRYYFLEMEKPYNVLADLSYQYGINNWHNPYGKISNLSLAAGPEVFFNSSVGLEFLLGYTRLKETIDNFPASYKQVRKGFRISIGIQLHLEKD